MQITQIITRLATGGAQEMVLDIARFLKNQDVDSIILTGVTSENSKAGNNNRLYKQCIEEGLNVSLIPKLTESFNFISDIYVLFWLYRYLSNNRERVIHFHSSKIGVLGRFAALAAFHNKIIFHVHGLSFSKYRGLKKLIFIFLEIILSNFNNAIIFVCKSDRDALLKFKIRKNVDYVVIYPCIEVKTVEKINKEKFLHSRQSAKRQFGFSEDEIIVGSIGRLDDQKNPLDFIKLASDLKALPFKKKFIWVGDGTLERIVKNKIREFSIEDLVIMPGYQLNVDDYFKSIDYFIITSKYEGLPVTAVKAILHGCVVIAYSVNGLKDLDELFSTVILSNNNSVTSLSSSLLQNITIHELNINECFLNSVKASELLNRERMMTSILNLYSNVNRYD
jgi:glycosyltransferase involved in cell wall biosynthesis